MDAHIFAMNRPSRRTSLDRKVERNKLYCSTCKKSGHDVSIFFKIYGIPLWWTEKFGNRKEGLKDGDRGITTSIGKSKGKGPVMLQPNAMFSGGSGGSTNEGPRSASGGTSLNDLSPAQIQRFVETGKCRIS